MKRPAYSVISRELNDFWFQIIGLKSLSVIFLSEWERRKYEPWELSQRQRREVAEYEEEGL